MPSGSVGLPWLLPAMRVTATDRPQARVTIFGTGIHNVIVAITIPLIPRCGPRFALERIVDPRGALHRRRARLRLWPFADHPAPHGPQCDGAVPDPADRFVGQAILAEASLSYLGLGVEEPVPAWGLMLQGGAEEYASTAPWIAVFPGLAIALTVFGLSPSATPCATPSIPSCATAEPRLPCTLPSLSRQAPPSPGSRGASSWRTRLARRDSPSNLVPPRIQKPPPQLQIPCYLNDALPRPPGAPPRSASAPSDIPGASSSVPLLEKLPLISVSHFSGALQSSVSRRKPKLGPISSQQGERCRHQLCCFN